MRAECLWADHECVRECVRQPNQRGGRTLRTDMYSMCLAGQATGQATGQTGQAAGQFAGQVTGQTQCLAGQATGQGPRQWHVMSCYAMLCHCVTLHYGALLRLRCNTMHHYVMM